MVGRNNTFETQREKKKLLVTYSAFVIVLCHSHMYWVSKYKHLRVYAELALFCRIVSFFLFRRCYTSFCLILAYTDRCVLMLMCAQLHHHTGTPFFYAVANITSLHLTLQENHKKRGGGKESIVFHGFALVSAAYLRPIRITL